MFEKIVIGIRFALVYFFKGVLVFIPKKRNQIMFTSWFGKKYADSSMFMFEYLLKNGNYNVVWLARDKELYRTLKERGLPVVYGIKGIWQQIRSKMLISSVQYSDYYYYFLRNCIFFDLDHGFALKDCGLLMPGTPKWLYSFDSLIKKGVNYWQSAPTPFGMDKVCKCYAVNPNQVVRCNKPRTDVLFDKELQKGKNEIIEEIKKGRKAIVWMPTHRSDGKVPIRISKLVDLEKLQMLCEKHNMVFIVKKHFYHQNEREDFDRFPNIFDVTNESIDSQVILAQSDALVSDYSSSYIEYLILDRPIILYAYDKDYYLANERGLFVKFEDITAGEKVYDSDSFLKSIDRIGNDWYDKNYSEGRKLSRQLYFDENFIPGQYRESVRIIIDKLLDNKYSPNWN